MDAGVFWLRMCCLVAVMLAVAGLAMLGSSEDTDFGAFLMLWLFMKLATWASSLVLGALFFAMATSKEKAVWLEGGKSVSAPYGPGIPSRAFLAASQAGCLDCGVGDGGAAGGVSGAYGGGQSKAGAAGQLPSRTDVLLAGTVARLVRAHGTLAALPDEAEAQRAWVETQEARHDARMAAAARRDAFWESALPAPCYAFACGPDRCGGGDSGSGRKAQASGGFIAKAKARESQAGGGVRGQGPSAKRLAERMRSETKARDEYRKAHYAGNAKPKKAGWFS